MGKNGWDAADFMGKKALVCRIGVDGENNKKNAGIVKENGADVLVAESFIFKSGNYAEAIRQLKDL